MNSTIASDIVIPQRAAVFELLPRIYQPLLVDRDTFLLLYLRFEVLHCALDKCQYIQRRSANALVRATTLSGISVPSQSPDEDIHMVVIGVCTAESGSGLPKVSQVYVIYGLRKEIVG